MHNANDDVKRTAEKLQSQSDEDCTAGLSSTEIRSLAGAYLNMVKVAEQQARPDPATLSELLTKRREAAQDATALLALASSLEQGLTITTILFESVGSENPIGLKLTPNAFGNHVDDTALPGRKKTVPFGTAEVRKEFLDALGPIAIDLHEMFANRVADLTIQLRDRAARLLTHNQNQTAGS